VSSVLEPKESRDNGGRNEPRQRRRWFGPGTWLALLIGAAVLAAPAWNRQGEPPTNAGRIVYEADSHGKMKAVSASSTGGDSIVPAPAQPLWKPEAGRLLERDLALSASQRRAILLLDRAWRHEKASLKTALEDAAAGASTVIVRRREEHAVSLNMLRQGLGEYSALSREYDSRRADYWFRATLLLGRAQREKVEQLSRRIPSVPPRRTL
jgi:hypothetical protein